MPLIIKRPSSSTVLFSYKPVPSLAQSVSLIVECLQCLITSILALIGAHWMVLGFRKNAFVRYLLPTPVLERVCHLPIVLNFAHVHSYIAIVVLAVILFFCRWTPIGIDFEIFILIYIYI